MIGSVVIALLASGCSSPTARQAGLFGGGDPDPVGLPALTPVASGNGEMVTPVFGGTVLGVSTKGSLISTSTEPTLDATVTVTQGVAKVNKKVRKSASNGAWQFWVGDLTANPTQTAGWTSVPPGASPGKARVTRGTLSDGRAYLWKALSPTGQQIGPTPFTVDTTRVKDQASDEFSGVGIEVSTGRAHVTQQSHQMNSASGGIGIGLDYEPGNDPWPGMPKNWRLVVPNAVTWDQLVTQNTSASVINLHSKSGLWLTYKDTGHGVYEPVWRKNTPAPTGQFPTVIRNDNNKDQPWTVTDVNQTVTTFGPANKDTQVAQVAAVSLSSVLGIKQQYDDAGRVTGLTDSVSNRSVKLTYGGGDCPSFGEGFIDAPEGMLCKATFWDGSQSWIGYVDTALGPQIGRFADNADTPGVAVDDYAYDQAGRLARQRSPLMALLQAADQAPTDDSALTSVAYDNTGRVTQITSPVATKGGTRLARTYTYGTNLTTLKRFNVSTGQSDVMSQVSYDPNTFNVKTVRDSEGLLTTYTWDAATDNLVTQKNPSGSTIQFAYDDAGRLTTQTGPSININSSSQQKAFEYDESYSSPSAAGQSWTGLHFQVWSNGMWSGSPATATLGPQLANGTVPSQLSASWQSAPPGGGDGAWSARLSGNIKIAKDGNYSFDSPGSSLWVDGTKCDVQSKSCVNLALTAGNHSIRIDFAAPQGGGAGVRLMMDPGPGAAKTLVPMKQLAPNYGLRTKSGSRDYAKGAVQTLASTTLYEQPGNSQATQMLNQAGFGMKSAYEALDQLAGKYGRPTTVTQPQGSQTAFSYWGNDEKVAPDGCSGHDAAVQGGLPSEVADPDPTSGDPNGQRYRQWYNEAGIRVAQKIAGLPIKCYYHDESGRIVSTVQGEGDSQEKAEIDYAVDGNPLVSRATFTVDDGVTGKSTFVTEVTSDLAGRPTRVVDAFGSVATTVYDEVTGKPTITTTTVNPDSSDRYVVTTKNVYGSSGAVDSVTITDNRGSKPVSATTKHSQANGMLTQVSYSNGTTGQYGFDNNQRANSASWSGPSGQTWSSNRVYAPSGRATSDKVKVPGSSAGFDYDYDLAGRLTSANLATDLKGLPKSWKYTYDQNNNRTAQQIDGQSMTYAYDKADRLLNVKGDPVLSGDVKYDGNNSITEIGPLKISYGITGQVAKVEDTARNIQVSYLRDGDANILAKTATVNGTSTTMKYTMDGILLDANNKPYLQQVSLPGGVVVQRAIPGVQTQAQPQRSAGENDTESSSAAAPAATESAAAQGDPSPSASAAPSEATTESASPSKSEGATAETPKPEASTSAPEKADSPEPPATTWLYESFAGGAFYQAKDDGTGIGSLMINDPFGQSLTPLPSPGGAQPTLRWMTAHMIESEALSTQVNVLGQRLYLPALGRFTSVDPQQGGGSNLYDYAMQDPINNADTNGQDSFDRFMWSIVGGLAVSIGMGGLFTWGLTKAAGINAASSVYSYIAIQMTSSVFSQLTALGVSEKISGTPFSWHDFAMTAAVGAFTGAIGGVLAKEGAMIEEANSVRQSRLTNLRMQYDREQYEFEQARANPTSVGGKISAGFDKGVTFLGSAITGGEQQGFVTSFSYLNGVAIKILVMPQLWLMQYNSWRQSECAKHDVILKYFGDVCNSSS